MNSYNLPPEQALVFWKQFHAEVERQGGNAHDCERLLNEPAIMEAMTRHYLMVHCASLWWMCRHRQAVCCAM